MSKTWLVEEMCVRALMQCQCVCGERVKEMFVEEEFMKGPYVEGTYVEELGVKEKRIESVVCDL